MRVGILIEGVLDREPIQSLVERIILNIYSDPELQFILHKANGPIVSNLEIAVTIFFESRPRCDIAVFVGDYDRSGENCRRVRNWVKQFVLLNAEEIIVTACPKPTLEAWLLEEEISIKKVLGLRPDEPLPHNKLSPKDRFMEIIGQFNREITKSAPEIYSEVARGMDLQYLYRKSPSFKSFYDELERVIRPFRPI